MTARSAIHVALEFQLGSPAPISAKAFLGRAEALMDELLVLEDTDPEIGDTSVGGDVDALTLTVDMIVFTDNQLDAAIKAMCTARTAIHALGDATPTWPRSDEILQALRQASIQTGRALVTA